MRSDHEACDPHCGLSFSADRRSVPHSDQGSAQKGYWTIKREIELAWAAGLFEGEGSLFIQRRCRDDQFQLLAAADLTMTDEDVVRRFHRVIGVGKVQYRPPGRDGWKSSYAWRLKGKDNVKGFIGLIYDDLGQRRKAKADEVLAECRRPQTRRPPTLETRRKISEANKRAWALKRECSTTN